MERNNDTKLNYTAEYKLKKSKDKAKQLVSEYKKQGKSTLSEKEKLKLIKKNRDQRIQNFVNDLNKPSYIERKNKKEQSKEIEELKIKNLERIEKINRIIERNEGKKVFKSSDNDSDSLYNKEKEVDKKFRKINEARSNLIDENLEKEEVKENISNLEIKEKEEFLNDKNAEISKPELILNQKKETIENEQGIILIKNIPKNIVK